MSLRPLIRSSWSPFNISSRYVSRLREAPPPFPVISKCPSPTCQCSPTPSMPEGLKIDHTRPLNGTMASYAEQVLVCTGRSDWKSRIEEENDGDNLAADLKELLGRGGIYSDPFHNVLITNSSFPSSLPKREEVQTTSVYILPSFQYVPFLPRVSFDSVQALVKGYLLPAKLSAFHDGLSPIHRDRLLRNKAYQSILFGVRDVNDILILICGHRGRDERCGIMGPLLQEEFRKTLPMAGIEVLQGQVEIDEYLENAKALEAPNLPNLAARVGLISHIGGHKFAGNVIIYIPPSARSGTGEAHTLAGCGIWYGRVEPKHVEGIVSHTILRGTVLKDMFRGGVKQGSEIITL